MAERWPSCLRAKVLNYLVADINNEAAQETLKQVREESGTIEFIVTDVTNNEMVANLVQSLSRSLRTYRCAS